MTTRLDRISLLAATALLGLAVGVSPALSAGTDSPAPPPAPADQKGTDSKAPDDKKATDQLELKSQRDFLNGYRHAYDLIQNGQYEAGIAALRALKQDDHPDVANYVGYASRKLGRYDDAKLWYEKALAADPKHVRTWSYYGMWHAEQGNRLKAEDYLQTIKLICGDTSCEEFKALKDVLDGSVSY